VRDTFQREKNCPESNQQSASREVIKRQYNLYLEIEKEIFYFSKGFNPFFKSRIKEKSPPHQEG